MNKEGKLREENKSILEANKHTEERVFDEHGSNEYGLDLVILKIDAFGKLRSYGLQIKNR